MQEVPDEISLIFNISGCPNNCADCHTPELREDIGEYLSKDIPQIISKYDGIFTCVCFMGEGKSFNELKKLNDYCHALGYKTCLYSGNDNDRLLAYKLFDYLKLGSYQKKHGGLTSKTTNQRMYKLCDGEYIDITHRFHK